MSWSIKDLARMSGATPRMLRHYDEIGLLAPAWVGTNGYRYYEYEQLARLQQILLLRELDLGLADDRGNSRRPGRPAGRAAAPPPAAACRARPVRRVGSHRGQDHHPPARRHHHAS